MSCGNSGRSCRLLTPWREPRWSARWTRSTRATPGWRGWTHHRTRSWSTSGPNARSCWRSGCCPWRDRRSGTSATTTGWVLVPSFVNIGSYVDSGTMVDTWATVGSAAQIGRNVHLSGGVGIGGVLEPPNAVPVVVEDDAMIGSRCMVVGGARVRTGAVLGAGAILTSTTHVVDVETGSELPRGEAPAWSVCVGGTRARKFPGGEFGMPCLLVLRRLPPGTRHDKSELNAILRDHGLDA